MLKYCVVAGRLFFAVFLFGFLTFSFPLYSTDLHLEEERGATRGLFIVPNEGFFPLYRDVLANKTGAYLGVGTFRTLHHIAFGNFDLGVLLDYDQVTSDFNRANLELIATSRDRFEYLARLLVREKKAEAARTLRESHSDEDRIVHLRWMRIVSITEASHPFRNITDPTELEIARTLGEPVRKQPEYDPQGAVFKRALLADAIIRHMLNPETRDTSIFGSDVAFKKIQEMVQNKKIVVVTGDITGRKTIPSLAREIVGVRGQNFSVIDLSNLMEHFVTNRAKSTQKLLQNMEILQLKPDALILLTAASGPVKNVVKGVDPFIYFAYPYPEFKKLMAHQALETKPGYKQFVAASHALRQKTSPNGRLAIMGLNCFEMVQGLLPN